MGSLINNEKLDTAKVAFSATFNRAFEAERGKIDPAWNMLAYDVTMDHPTLQLNWIGDVPAMTEWIGERKLSKLRVDNFSVTSKKFANGFVINEDDIEDDVLGLYAGKIAALARKAVLFRVN